MAMHELQISGTMNTPVAYFGQVQAQTSPKFVVYRGEGIRAFLYKNGADPQGMRRFLLLNRVGRVFEMEAGIQVQLPAANTFKKHRDSV